MIYKLIYKLVFSFLHPETAHKIGIFTLKNAPFFFKQTLPKCEVDFFGKTLLNPIGIAAGFDKNAEAINGLFDIGFGFVEVGTVTPIPQRGNPLPRIFRVGQNAGIINRMGFPNLGYEAILKNLENFKKDNPNKIVGVNIGRNKDGNEDDYTFLIEKFIEVADYITINISSPNTEGLRNLLEKEPLGSFLLKIAQKRAELLTKKPFFLKISPDIESSSLTFIYELIVKNGIEGIIIANTTISRPNINLKNIKEIGGLSGKLLKEKSLNLLKDWNNLNKAGIYTISVGGIETKEDMEERLKNGANLIQIYTSFALNGDKVLKSMLK